jgi:hypothetical protein
MPVPKQYTTAAVESAINMANAQYYRHLARVRRVYMGHPRRLAMSGSSMSIVKAEIRARSGLSARNAQD